MPDRDDPNPPRPANDPRETRRPDPTLPPRTAPTDHEIHARAEESGRSAAKWIGWIVLAVIVILVLLWTLGGGIFTGAETGAPADAQ